MLKTFFQTDQGKVRPHNEDNGAVIQISASDVFAVVADGMGGAKAGDVASQKAVDYIKEHLDTYRSNADNTTATILHSLIEGANSNIYSYSREHPDCQGMGTTMVAVRATEDQFILGHVGDSRCYRIHNQTIDQITEDHTLVNELVKSGQITQEEAEFHPRKHWILRALGTDPSVEIDVLSNRWNPGDYLLLCSDGLTNKVNADSIKSVIQSRETLEQKCARLVSMANEAGGDDNITVILLYNDVPTEAGAAT